METAFLGIKFGLSGHDSASRQQCLRRRMWMDWKSLLLNLHSSVHDYRDPLLVETVPDLLKSLSQYSV